MTDFPPELASFAWLRLTRDVWTVELVDRCFLATTEGTLGSRWCWHQPKLLAL
jgi:hypothetical protein